MAAKYTPSQIEKLFKRVLKSLVSGKPLGQSLDAVGMPSRTSFYNWLDTIDGYSERYGRAKEIAAEKLFDEMLEISRATLEETITTIGDGLTVTTKDNVARSRLQIDVIKWRLAKEAPKKYGDKLDVTSDNKALSVAPIVGMIIKNETTTNDDDPEEPADNDLF